MLKTKSTTWSTKTDRHLLRGRGVTTQGRKPETRAAHRSVARASVGDVVLNGGREVF